MTLQVDRETGASARAAEEKVMKAYSLLGLKRKFVYSLFEHLQFRSAMAITDKFPSLEEVGSMRFAQLSMSRRVSFHASGLQICA
jgi:hypothetical protein